MNDKKKGPPHGGGSREGRRNKLTGAHGDLINAWDHVSGPKTAEKIMKSAIDEAIGREVPVLDARGRPVMEKGKPKTKKLTPNFDPLRSLLPYIARKMPETLENKFFDDLPEKLREARNRAKQKPQ